MTYYPIITNLRLRNITKLYVNYKIIALMADKQKNKFAIFLTTLYAVVTLIYLNNCFENNYFAPMVINGNNFNYGWILNFFELCLATVTIKNKFFLKKYKFWFLFDILNVCFSSMYKNWQWYLMCQWVKYPLDQCILWQRSPVEFRS